MIITDVGPRMANAIAPAFMKRGIINMLVPDDLRKSVLFIGIKQDDRFIPKATGFFVGYADGGFTFSYIVTAEHVISGLITKGHDIWLRCNNKEGGVTESNFGTTGWLYHPGNPEEQSDVAICMATPTDEEDVLRIGLAGSNSMLLTEEENAILKIGIGDEISIVGLFKSHFGREKNIPIVRTGNISAMADEPVFTRYCGYTTAHLVEARSINGLSGSPVFVNMPLNRVVDNVLVQNTGRRFYLLGLMHGHFDVENISEDLVVDDAAGSSVGINTGIGLVIPTSKIMETLLQDEAKQIRQRMIDDLKARQGATPDNNAEVTPST